MKKKGLGIAWAGLLILGQIGTAQAALFDRGAGMIYDDVLNITWLQDANYAQTSGYDADGRMTWQNAVNWADGLSYYDSVRDTTWSDWRLPTMMDSGAPGCNWAYSGTDCGYNPQTTSGQMVYSELASLWYDTLGNKAYADASGTSPQTYWGLNNRGPFDNVPRYYATYESKGSYQQWFGTENAAKPSQAWLLNTEFGSQSSGTKTGEYFAWAVRPGDVAPVPLPAAAWLFGSGLAGLGLFGRLRRR